MLVGTALLGSLPFFSQEISAMRKSAQTSACKNQNPLKPLKLLLLQRTMD